MTLDQHTVKSYDKDLQSVCGTIDEMSHLTLESLDITASAIKTQEESLINIITSHDYKINSLDFLVERKVTSMLALRQPMAVDLRYIVSALKVASNLERIGDQSKNIVKKLVNIEKIDEKAKNSLIEMLEISKNMIINSVKSFNEQNEKIAQQVLEQDDEIDKIYKDVFSILNHEKYTHEQVEDIIKTLFIAKSFERLADHTTNIAEIAQYVVTGETK